METRVKGMPLSNISCTMFLMLYGRVTEGCSKDSKTVYRSFFGKAGWRTGMTSSTWR